MSSGIKYLVINIEHDIDEQYQYTPGEIIRGQISVVTSRTIRLSSITIQIRGEGVVAWEDGDSRSGYSANEMYINASKLLPEARDQTLREGSNEFDFEYDLPDNLPSSYIGKYGSVTYVLKATAVGERRTDTAITSEPFLVLRHTVVPAGHDLKVFVNAHKKIYGSCWFGNVKVMASVHKTGILPGEDLFINAEIKNKCPKTITAVQAALLMDTRYHAQNTINNFRQIINRRRDEVELMRNEGRRWQNVRLTVPPYIPESKLDFCDIIDIEYMFQLRVEVSGGTDILLDVPITIASSQSSEPTIEKEARRHASTNTNATWTDMTAKHFKHFALSDLDVPNGDVPHRPSWHGDTLPELRQNTKIDNPLFDKMDSFHRMSEADCDMGEVIESTKL